MSTIKNLVPIAPTILESKVGWSMYSISVATAYDEDLSSCSIVMTSESESTVSSISPLTSLISKITGLVSGTDYIANISLVDDFLADDLGLIEDIILAGNSEVLKATSVSISTNEYPQITSMVNEITSLAFTSDNVAIYLSGFADDVVVESIVGGIPSTVYSGPFSSKLIFTLPLGSYTLRVTPSILHLDNIYEFGAYVEGTIEVTELGTGWVEEIQEELQDTRDQVVDIENEVTDGLNLMQQQVDQVTGAISSQVVSVNKALKKSAEGGLNQLLAEYSLYLSKKEQLSLGQSIAAANFSIQAVANDTIAVAQSLLELTSSTGIALGQVNAEVTELNQAITSDDGAVALRINDLRTSMNAPGTGEIWALSEDISRVETKADGTQSAIAGLRTSIGATGADEEEIQSSAELILSTIQEEANTAYSRAFLGVTNVVGGRAVISGIAVGGVENGLNFQGDVFRLTDTLGNQRLYWDAANNTWVLRGRLILGDDYEVASEEDIRALDGNYVEFIYIASPSTPTTPTGTSPAGWSTNPPTTTEVIWASKATKTASGALVGSWSMPARWNGIQGEPGAAGANGLNSIIVFLYRRSSSVPTNPTTTSTYTFSTKVLTGFNNSWTTTVPSGTDPVYVIAATASSNTNTDTIAAAEWSSPTILAQNGVAGLNSATVFLYRRFSSTPSLPTSSGTYTFSTGTITGINNSWTQEVPTGADPLYITTATAVSSSTTDVIAPSEWATAKLFVVNGADGADGTNGTNGTDGADGADGANGAGFYGGRWSTISWTTSTANARFVEVALRSPVNGDILTQTRIDGTDSQARQFNGSAWGTVALQVNGSIVATGTIAGDRLIAGTSISAPVITGGTINGNTINSATINSATINSTNINGSVYNAVRGAKRVRVDPGSSLPFWFGNNNIAVASQTRENGDFWIDDSGRYPTPISSAGIGLVDLSSNGTEYWQPQVLPTSRAVALFEMTAIVGVISAMSPVTASASIDLQFSVENQFGQQIFVRRVPIRRYQQRNDDIIVTTDNVGVPFIDFGTSSHTNLNFFTNRTYSIRLRLFTTGVDSGTASVKYLLKTSENPAPFNGPILS